MTNRGAVDGIGGRAEAGCTNRLRRMTEPAALAAGSPRSGGAGPFPGWRVRAFLEKRSPQFVVQ